MIVWVNHCAFHTALLPIIVGSASYWLVRPAGVLQAMARPSNCGDILKLVSPSLGRKLPDGHANHMGTVKAHKIHGQSAAKHLRACPGYGEGSETRRWSRGLHESL